MIWYYRYKPLKPNREDEQWTMWFPLVEFRFVCYNVAAIEFKEL
jgi:hypothetical protein